MLISCFSFRYNSISLRFFLCYFLTSFGQFHHVFENQLGLLIPNCPKKHALTNTNCLHHPRDDVTHMGNYLDDQIHSHPKQFRFRIFWVINKLSAIRLICKKNLKSLLLRNTSEMHRMDERKSFVFLKQYRNCFS